MYLSLILLSWAPWILTGYLLIYFVRHYKYYKCAFQFPGIHPYLPPMLAPYLIAPRYNFDFYQSHMAYELKVHDAYITWLPELVYIIRGPELLQSFFNHPDLQNKSMHYSGVREAMGPAGLIAAGGETFRKSKKIFNKSFTASSQAIIFENFYRGAERVLAILEEKAGKGWFKMDQVIRKTVSLNICRTTLDMNFNENSGLIQFLGTLEHATYACIMAGCFGILKYDTILTKTSQKLRDFVAGRDKFCSEIIKLKRKDLREKVARKEDIPNQFIYNALRERMGDLDSNLTSDIITLLAAALDTSSITTGLALSLLGMHPDIQEKVYQEDKRIQEEIGDRSMTESDLSRYEYLHRVVKETLRLFPAVPVLGRNIDQEIKIGKYTFPKNACLSIFIPHIHRDPAYYPDPYKFDPDRFLPESIEKRPKYSYIPFSHGLRQCPGMRYGTQNAIFLTSSIIRKYKVYSKYKTVKEMDSNLNGFITLYDKEEIPMRVEVRL